RLGRRTVDLPLRPGANRPAGPRDPGVHRPRERPDDPAHARTQAGARDPPHLQRLLVLGPPVGLRPLARPARSVERDPPGLGPEHARTPRGLGRGRPIAVPWVEQARTSGTDRGVMHRSGSTAHVPVRRVGSGTMTPSTLKDSVCAVFWSNT